MPGSDEGELPRGVLTLEKQERLHESSDTKVQDGKVEHTNKSADPQLEPVCTETADQASSGPPGESNCTALPAPSEGASDDSDAGMHNSVSSVQMTDNGLEDAAHPDDHAPGRDAEEIAAAGCEQRPLDAPARTAAAESPLTQIVTSEMPPPAFLPRQLRMKRNAGRASEPPASGTSGYSVSTTRTAAGQTLEEGGQQDAEAPADDTQEAGNERSKVDDEFVLFMKEIEQLDSQREAQQQDSNSGGQEAVSIASVPETLPDSQQSSRTSPPASESPQNSADQGITATGIHEQQQPQDDEAVWQAVVDAATGKTYYWNVTTDEVTWESPGSSLQPSAAQVDTGAKHQQQQDLRQWAASTFRLTQELPTCSEKVQQLIFQLDFMEEELDAEYESCTVAGAAALREKADLSMRLQRFRSMRQRREQQRHKRSQETSASGSDDEFLKELIDLQLQQDRRPQPAQCAACKQRLAESRGTQSQQAKVRSLASSLARRLGNVEKEWASALLAALKARLDDWIDGGLSSSFFLKRLDKMQQDFQKHLLQDVEAEERHQELASVFPYSAAAASVSASGTVKSSSRNCLAGVAGTSALDKGGSGRPTTSGSRNAGAMQRGSSVSSEESTALGTAPPTPEGPPPTLPDEVAPAASEAAKAGAAPAAGMSLAVFNILQMVKDPELILLTYADIPITAF